MAYKLPEKIADMTVHHLYGLSKTGKYKTIDDYLKHYGYALAADLLLQGFKPSELEELVNSEKIGATNWPEQNSVTSLFWYKNEKTLRKLDELAAQVVQYCYGQDASQPIGGNFISIGAEIGNQQLALVGLIYARYQGKLREIPELDNGGGPLYIVKGSFSDLMFGILFSEKQQGDAK